MMRILIALMLISNWLPDLNAGEPIYKVVQPGELVHYNLKGTSIVKLVMNHIGFIIYEIVPDHDRSYCSQPKEVRNEKFKQERIRSEKYSAQLHFKRLKKDPPTDDVLRYGFLILGVFEGSGSSSLSTIPELPFNLSFTELTPGTKIYLTYQNGPEVIKAFNRHIFNSNYAERDVILPKWFSLGFDFELIRILPGSSVGVCQ